jgi:hypothetical protein
MTAYAPAVATTEAAEAANVATIAGIRVPGGRARPWLVGATLAGASATVAGVLLFRPWPQRNAFPYRDIAPVRNEIWTSIFIDSLAFALVAIALALTAGMLVRNRGAALANVGAVVTILGGILVAMGAFAFAAFAWYVTDEAILSPGSGGALLAYAVANPANLMLPQAVGFLLFTLGSLIIAAALLRARTVPRWLPILMIAGTVAQFAVAQRVLDLVQVTLMGILVVLATQLVRRGESPR